MTKKRGDGELIKVGELPIIKQLAKKFAPPTKAQQEFINAAVVIRTDPDAVERAFGPATVH